MKAAMSILTISLISMCCINKAAATDAGSPALSLGEKIGTPFRMNIGQGTNMVIAHEVKWTSVSGVAHGMYVIQEQGTRQTLAVNSTDNVFWVKGRLIAIETDVQSLSLIISQAVESSDLTESEMITIAHAIPRRKAVSLAPSLKSEKDQHLALPLFVQNFQARVQGDNLIIDFESYTHLRGSVVLDGNLDVLSMELTH
jgi:hypothetical protein